MQRRDLLAQKRVRFHQRDKCFHVGVVQVGNTRECVGDDRGDKRDTRQKLAKGWIGRAKDGDLSQEHRDGVATEVAQQVRQTGDNEVGVERHPRHGPRAKRDQQRPLGRPLRGHAHKVRRGQPLVQWRR